MDESWDEKAPKMRQSGGNGSKVFAGQTLLLDQLSNPRESADLYGLPADETRL